MKRPWLIAALALLALSNVWVLIHVARNRSGSPDADLELTSRELVYYGGRSEDSSVVLRLRWQNPAPEYEITGIEWPGWFDRKKVEELGFDLRVPADAKDAARGIAVRAVGDEREAAPLKVHCGGEVEAPRRREAVAGREERVRQQVGREEWCRRHGS